MTEEYYTDYPKEPIGGGNPYYRCSYCGISDPQINGQLKNHSKYCEYRIKKEQKMNDKQHKIVQAFDDRYENLGPFDEDWQELCIAATLRELVKQYSYNHLHIDGDHGLDVINVKDILKVIKELEEGYGKLWRKYSNRS